MKRAAMERPRAHRTMLRHVAMYALPAHELHAGHFRKGLRVGGCGNAACRLCHAGKLDGFPTLQQWRHDLTFREQLNDVAT